jgi:hypothetical protein
MGMVGSLSARLSGLNVFLDSFALHFFHFALFIFVSVFYSVSHNPTTVALAVSSLLIVYFMCLFLVAPRLLLLRFCVLSFVLCFDVE